LSQWLDPGELSDPVPLRDPAPVRSVVSEHLRLGFTHIVPFGLDHILFILGLFLLTSSLSAVLMQATAFTVAHSITLALAVCGVVSPPPAIVEPLIAASIVVVGVENVLARRATARRTLLAFAFGLLHGLGFASVLTESGMPPGHLWVALLSFNVGVELGQAAVLLGAFLLVGAWFSQRTWYRARIAIPASVTIAAVAAFWTVQRLGW
jgi:hypothetical protein